jgi:integrase
MKMREAHIVPLAQQSVDILKALVPITGRQQYVFPAIGSGGRPLSGNTLNGAIRRLGYSGEEMTSHGFRSMASTLLNEQGVHPDLIELQLAHAERNTVRAAYNRAQRLAERRTMMQNWAATQIICERRPTHLWPFPTEATLAEGSRRLARRDGLRAALDVAQSRPIEL